MTRIGHPAGTVVVLLLLVTPQLHAATIEGRVIHPERPNAAVGLEVVAAGLSSDGERIERITRTDKHGSFRLSQLPGPAVYRLSTQYSGIRFQGSSVAFKKDDPSEPRHVILHIYDPSTDASQVALNRVRVVVEREAGSYRISHDIMVTNPGKAVILRQDSEAPALRVGLPTGPGELEMLSGPLGEGQRIVDNTLELRGPLYPGEQEIRLVYDVARAETNLEARIRFPDPVERLDLYVKDFGIKVDAGPLHVARSVRKGDVIYQSYFGFDLSRGAEIPVHVQALPPRMAPPGWVRALLLALVGLGSALVVARPVVGAAGDGGTAETEEMPEKEALIAALEDLEHDFETGKLSTEDRDQLRRDLKREALQAMARTRRPEPAAKETPTATAGPCQCGNIPRPGDRFCSVCGSQL